MLTERFEAALVLAYRLHANQKRKVGNVPYIAHLLSVAALVLEDGGTEDEAIAALLHDAVEDQGGEKTRQIIYQQFGNQVGRIVDGCTEPYQLPKPPWKERKLAYLNNIQQASAEIQRVSLADKLHNARSTLLSLQQDGEAAVWQKFHAGREETLWFYQSLLAIYQATLPSRMTQEFAQVVEQLENWRSDPL